MGTRGTAATLLAIVALFVALALSACSGPQPAASGGASAQGQQQATKETVPKTAKRVKLSMVLNDKSTWYKAGQKFANDVSQKTSGAYRVELYPNNELAGGNLTKVIEMLKSGAIDIHMSGAINFTSFQQKFTVFGLPWLFHNEVAVDKAMKGPAVQEIRKLGEQNDMVLLAFGENGFRQITNSKREITKPDDLKGMTIRIPPMKLYTDLFRVLEANPITLDFAEVYTALQRGAADGQENPLGTFMSARIHEVQKYATIWNYSYDPLFFAASPVFWNSLDSDTQETVQQAAQEAMQYQVDLHRTSEKELAGELAKQGVKVTTLNDEQIKAFYAKMTPIYQEWEPVVGKDLLDSLKSAK